MRYGDDERGSVGSERRPACFGDAEEHSARDRVCQGCRFFQTCAIIVRGKTASSREPIRNGERAPERRGDYRREDRRDYRRDEGRRTIRAPDPEDFIERDDDDVSFWGALFFNGAMSGLRAGLVEAVFASDQIPRFQYPDPFRAAFKRKDEDDR